MRSLAQGLHHTSTRWSGVAFAGRLAALVDAEQVSIRSASRLSGGAIQENHRLDVDVRDGRYAGHRVWVLRTGSPSTVAASRPREQEYALLVAAHAAGVCTPAPIAFDPGDAEWPAFMVMSHVPGEASGRVLTRDAAIPQAALVEAIGANLARLHAVQIAGTRGAALAFLGTRPANPTRDLAHGYQQSVTHWHARTGNARPVLTWTLRWLAARLPQREAAVLVHRDYRVGNLMVDQGRLVATLDWEFAGWGNPLEDLGWFCAPCWRFARGDRDAGGLAAVEDLLRGYNQVAGTSIAADELPFWQVLAELRWAVIALQQTLRFLDGGEASLELALTGRMLPELESHMLAMTGDMLA